MPDHNAVLEDRLRITLHAVADLLEGSLELDAAPAPAREHASRRRTTIYALALTAAAGIVVATVSFLPRGHARTGPVALDTRAISLIDQSSAAVLDSGQAHVTVVQTEAPPKNVTSSTTVYVMRGPITWSIEMAFSSPNVSETVTQSMPGPPGVPTTTEYGLELVDGFAYRQDGGVPYKEAATSVKDFLTVPTPTTFLAALTSDAQLVETGKDPATGWEILQARHPEAAADALNGQITGLARGKITSLTISVDSDQVVRRMAWATASNSAGIICFVTSSRSALTCQGGYAETESVDMTFTQVGTPQTFTVPAGALPGSGPFDEPNG